MSGIPLIGAYHGLIETLSSMINARRARRSQHFVIFSRLVLNSTHAAFSSLPVLNKKIRHRPVSASC